MRKSISRAAKITVTAASVAALGATFVGTAAASSFGYHGHAPSDPHGHSHDSGSGLGGFTNESFGDYMQSFSDQPDDSYDDKSFCGGDGRDNGQGTHRSYKHDNHGYTFGDGHGKGSHYDFDKGENC